MPKRYDDIPHTGVALWRAMYCATVLYVMSCNRDVMPCNMDVMPCNRDVQFVVPCSKDVLIVMSYY